MFHKVIEKKIVDHHKLNKITVIILINFPLQKKNIVKIKDDLILQL